MILGPASLADVGGMMAVKQALRIDVGADGAPSGGFLLGASAEQYAWFVENARAWVPATGGSGLLQEVFRNTRCSR